jgi:hypothetical protein
MITPLFYPGQKVICVNDDFTVLLAQNPTINTPVKDEVYTIRKNFQFTHNVGVVVEEIYNLCIQGSRIEPNFAQDRFVVASNVVGLEVVKEEELQAA